MILYNSLISLLPLAFRLFSLAKAGFETYSGRFVLSSDTAVASALEYDLYQPDTKIQLV